MEQRKKHLQMGPTTKDNTKMGTDMDKEHQCIKMAVKTQEISIKR